MATTLIYLSYIYSYVHTDRYYYLIDSSTQLYLFNVYVHAIGVRSGG